MSFNKAGQELPSVKWKRARKSRYGGKKKVKEPIALEDRKVVMSICLPLWQVEWLKGKAWDIGLSASAFMAQMVESTKEEFERVEVEQKRLEDEAERRGLEVEDLEDDDE